MPTLSPTQSDVQKALREFLLNVLPAGIEVISADDNKVPPPSAQTYVEIRTLRGDRISTNVDESADVRFTASIDGPKMTVTSVQLGALAPGAAVFGVGVAIGTAIDSQASGTPGQEGLYAVSVAQTLAPRTLSAGTKTVTESWLHVFQVDFHSVDLTSGDMARVFSSLMRDDYATTFFAGKNPAISPLHADEPRYLAFMNDQQQYERRWMVEAHVQADQTVAVPQQYMDAFDVTIVSVDATYPPA